MLYFTILHFGIIIAPFRGYRKETLAKISSSSNQVRVTSVASNIKNQVSRFHRSNNQTPVLTVKLSWKTKYETKNMKNVNFVPKNVQSGDFRAYPSLSWKTVTVSSLWMTVITHKFHEIWLLDFVKCFHFCFFGPKNLPFFKNSRVIYTHSWIPAIRSSIILEKTNKQIHKKNKKTLFWAQKWYI